LVFSLIAVTWIIITYFFLTPLLPFESSLISSNVVVTLVSFPVWIAGVFTFAYSITVSNKTHKSIQNSATQIERIVVVLLFIDFVFFFVEDLFVTFNAYPLVGIIQLQLFILGNALFVLGFLFLIFNYLRHPTYVFYLPHPIYEILFYNLSGIMIYSRTIKKSQILDPEKRQLISGVFVAISALFRESLGHSAKLNQIDLSQYQIYFAEAPGSGAVAVITSQGNYYLQKAIEKFIRLIPSDLAPKLKNIVQITPEITEMFDLNLIKAFPFLDLD